jgi:hypothetical protein
MTSVLLYDLDVDGTAAFDMGRSQKKGVIVGQFNDSSTCASDGTGCFKAGDSICPKSASGGYKCTRN